MLQSEYLDLAIELYDIYSAHDIHHRRWLTARELQRIKGGPGLIAKVKNKKGKLVLLQGDSWMEQVQEIDESLKLFQDFSKKNDINIINGGITSYAPTLMSLQYKFLKTDFDINPSIVVIYVDQTDIGDEICRYDPSKKYKEKKIS